MKNTFDYKLSVLYYGVDDTVNNHEYFVNDIFANYKHIECDYILVGQEDHTDKIYDVFIYHCTDPNRLNHFGFSPTYEQTKNAVLKFKPKIILQLADEYHSEHNEIHNLLSNFCNLFLRQYRHQSHFYCYSENVVPIPLGYVNGIQIKNNPKIKPMKDRKYNWSWVGTMKTDRRYMINTFWNMWKSVVISNAYLSTSEIFDLYCESIFVPCGRGNISLDCFRLYESTLAGAIPVVVGSPEEIDSTFCFFDERPPWIFAESWEEAIHKCQQVEGNFEILQDMQNQNINWWNKIVNLIQCKVSDALKENVCDHSEVMNYVIDQENNIEKTRTVVWYNT